MQLSKNQFEPEDNLPSKDHFYKTNAIFNNLFKRNVLLREAQGSKTNMLSLIWVNFAQADTKTVARDLGSREFLLECGHAVSTRIGGRTLEVGSEATCLRCGSNAAYRSFEHEWSHIIFGSSPLANKMFVSQLRDYINQKYGLVSPDLLRMVVEAFDDLRVNSLWGLAYAGSADGIAQRWKEKCEETENINENFPVWVSGVALGASNLGRGPFSKLYAITKEATEAAKGRSLENMFVIVRWFIEKCIHRLIDPTPPEEEPQGKQQKEKPNPSPPKRRGEDNVEQYTPDDLRQDTDRGEPPRTEEQALRWLAAKASAFRSGQEHHIPNFTEEDAHKRHFDTSCVRRSMDKICDHGQPVAQAVGQPSSVDEDVRKAVNALKESTEEKISSNQFLIADTLDKVLMIDVLPENIDQNAKITLDPDDEENIDRMRAIFAKYIGKKMTRRCSEGDEIDVQALIRYHLEGEEEDLFEEDGFTQGFAYMTLCDMSDSMSGQPFADVCKGSEMLKASLDYPFVIPHLWGFRGAEVDARQAGLYTLEAQRLQVLTRGGESWIYKYDRDCEGFLGKNAIGYNREGQRVDVPVRCGGLTPMNTGLHIATKYLSTHVPSGMEKKIFLLTDGAPTQFHASGVEVSPETLLRLVRFEVTQARNKGIQVYPILIGDSISDDVATTMFGPSAFWKRATTKTIGSTLMTLVLKDFVRYLKR